ncbi:hypothetical protein D9M72_115370 [compost metagenome]
MREERLVLGDEHVVAAGHHDRHAVFAGQRAVDSGFAQFLVAQPDAREGKAVDRVREDAAALRARVVAHHAQRVHAFFHAGHHAQVARLALHDTGACIEHIGRHVAKAAVRVVHQHLGGAGVEGAGNRGVGLLRHQHAGAFVLGVALARLLVVVDARNAFDVGGDQDFHGRVFQARGEREDAGSSSPSAARWLPSRPVTGVARHSA